MANVILTISTPNGELDSNVMTQEQVSMELNKISSILEGITNVQLYNLTYEGGMVSIPRQVLSSSVFFVKKV